MSPTGRTVIAVDDVSKYFESTATMAVDGVSFTAVAGEVVAICGENGAGKSTLMNLLSGVLTPDSGSISVNDLAVASSASALRAGVGMVHQHFELVPSFTVAENVMLGSEPTKSGFVDERRAVVATTELAAEFNLPIDPNSVVATLPVGMRQRVEILKALRTRAGVLILDEPTAVLTPTEARELMAVVRRLAASGHTVLLITHKLDEVMHASDRVIVMRRGQVVSDVPTSETTIAEIAETMVGRVVRPAAPEPVAVGNVAITVCGLSERVYGAVAVVDDVSFEVRAGQILGIAGVTGNGQTELIELLTGLRKPTSGTVTVAGVDLTGADVRAYRRHLAHIPEDRLAMGIDASATITANVTAPNVRRMRRGAFLDLGKMRAAALDVIQRFQVASGTPTTIVGELSGGNMQKVILGRELSSDPAVIIANQPTRGLDVGSIEYVHGALLEARRRGAAIVLVSAEIDEVLALSDLVAVMTRGRLHGPFPAAETGANHIGLLMAGAVGTRVSGVVVAADAVVTLDGAVHEPGFVAIDGGLITDVGSGRPSGSGVTDLGARIVMPGLVNAHTHTPMSIFRGVSEGRSLLTLDGWYDTIRTLEQQLTADLVPAAVELSCAEMIAAGTTGLADQYFFADVVAEGIRRSGLRATVAYGIVELGDNTARATELDRAAAFVRTGGGDPLVRPWLGPHAFFVDNTEEAILAELELADHFGVGLHTHFSTTGEEDVICLERHGTTAIARLAELGVLDRPLVLAHCLELHEDDLSLLAGAPVVVVLIASVAMASGAAAPRLRRLIDAGVTVAIGSDNVANNGSYDLFEEMRTLSRLSAFVEATPGVVSSDELLALACAGGAAAIGSNGGRLAPGADADLISLDVSALNRGPTAAQSLSSAIVWGGSAGCVTDVMVAGRWLQRDRHQLTVDGASARHRVDRDFAELLARRSNAT